MHRSRRARASPLLSFLTRAHTHFSVPSASHCGRPLLTASPPFPLQSHILLRTPIAHFAWDCALKTQRTTRVPLPAVISRGDLLPQRRLKEREGGRKEEQSKQAVLAPLLAFPSLLKERKKGSARLQRVLRCVSQWAALASRSARHGGDGGEKGEGARRVFSGVLLFFSAFRRCGFGSKSALVQSRTR